MLRALVTNFVGRDSSNTYRVDTDLGADFAQRSDSDFAWSWRGRSVLDAEKQLHDLLATTTTTAPAVRHICPVATTTTTSPPAGRFIALKLSPGFASEIERETFALCVAGVEEDASR